MTKEEKLAFLNKELENINNEVAQINITMEFIKSLDEIPPVYEGNFYNYDRTLAFFTEKTSWIQAKIQEIEAE